MDHHRQAAVVGAARRLSTANISTSRIASPNPSRCSRPDLICAGMSARGFEFSVRQADACFIGGRDEAETARCLAPRQDRWRQAGQDHQDLCHVHHHPWRQRCRGRKDRAPHYRAGLDEGAVLGMLESYGVLRQRHDGARARRLHDPYRDRQRPPPAPSRSKTSCATARWTG